MMQRFQSIKRWLIAGLVVSLGMAVVGGKLIAHSANVPNSFLTTPINVVVGHVGQADVPTTVAALGSLSAVNMVTVSASTDGRISSIDFKNGQQVAKGMPIVQMDNSQAQADYQSAVTAFNLSRTKYERSQLLVNEAVSKQELAELQSDMESKESAVKSALADLNQKEITAPFSGVLDAFQVNVGDFIKAGAPIVTLVNIEQLRVDYSLPENMLASIKQGQLVTVQVSAYPDKTFYGTVNFISPTVSPDTRSVAVQALVPNPDGLLSPGMFVHIEQQIAVAKNALVVPEAAVLADIKGYYVYKIVGNKAVQTYIQPGQRQNGQVQVLSGLTLNDVIVTEGLQKLMDGSMVAIMPGSGS